MKQPSSLHSQFRTPAPLRIDLHSHAGRCYLTGLHQRHPLSTALGAPTVGEAVHAAHRAGVTAISLATVADLAVLRLDQAGGLHAHRDFASGEAWADHRRQLAGLRDAVDNAGFAIATTGADLRDALRENRTVVMLSCEGGDFLEGDLSRLEEVSRQGVSSLTLVHYRVNEIGDVQTEPAAHGGLSAFGREVVAECNRLGLIIDCAHASMATTMAVLETSRHPVMISHSHLDHPDRSHPRLLSSQHARAVAEAGGLIGAWPSGVACRSLADFAGEIVRLTEIVGVDHVGIGTDLDGNYRPVLTDYRQFDALAEYLATGGHGSLSQADITKVLGGNALNLIETVCG